MNEYETEEQQVEALKKWLKENIFSIMAGLGIGLAGLAGWNYYMVQKDTHLLQASDMYMEVVQNIAINGVNEKVIDMNTQMVTEYADTPYASLAALFIASKEYEKGNTDEVIAQYEWVIKHSPIEELKTIAEVRLTRILIEQQKYDEAKTYINASHAAAFDAVYEELKGDLLVAKGNRNEARQAYDKAIELSEKPGRWLILKRQNLGGNNSEPSLRKS